MRPPLGRNEEVSLADPLASLVIFPRHNALYRTQVIGSSLGRYKVETGVADENLDLTGFRLLQRITERKHLA